MKLKLFFLLLFFLNINYSCDQPDENNKTNGLTKFNELTVDSIYENFEDIAYNRRERYISNPDSFLNSLLVAPSSEYQKEMFTYGLIFIGYALMENGDIYESIKYYEKAYNYSKSEQVKIDDINTTITKPLSNLYTRINDTEKAINLLKQSIKNTVDEDMLPGLYNNLANAYLYNDQTDSAEVILHNALKTKINDKHKALLYNSLSTIYNEKKDLKSSIKYNQLAVEIFEHENLKDDTILWYISALSTHAILHSQISSIHKALQITEQEFPKIQNRLKAKLLSVEIDLLYSSNSKQDILNKYNDILTFFKAEKKDFILDYTYTKALFGKAKYYKNKNLLDSALIFYEQGIENDFRTQQLITSTKDQIRNNLNNKQIIEELIELINVNESLQKDSKVIEQLLWCIELSKARLLINEINRSDQWDKSNQETKDAVRKIQVLYQQKDQSSNSIKKQNIQKLIDQIQIEFQLSEKYFETIRFIPNKDSFLENLRLSSTDFYSYYITTDNRVTIIHRVDGKNKYYQIDNQIFISSINELKDNYFGSSPNYYNANPKKYKQSTAQIANNLLPDLTQENVYISLDGALYGLPFDAFYKNGFLVESHNFAYLNSFLLFNILEKKANKHSAISLLYRSEYLSPLPSLNFVEKEIDKISKVYASEKIGTHQQSDKILHQQFAKSNIIHIAAHTILDSTESPLIYLKNPLSTNQIRYLEIKSPLVFLSACNTGKGESLPSEGTESIQRVFLSKNVPSVISTYWFANDETMLKITDNFYQYLYQKEDPIIALADAKRHYLSKTNSQYQNPWYWANINYSGVGNNIGLKKTPNQYMIYLCLSLSVIIILILKHTFRKKKTWGENDYR